MKLLLAVGLYIASLSALWLMNRREFSRCPEKGERYRKLPIGYKLACWFGVVPLVAASIFVPGVILLAFIAFAVLEGACVRWYRKHGLLQW